MSNNDIELDEYATRRILGALVEQAAADLKRKSEQDNAIRFFRSPVFVMIAPLLHLNEKECRKEANRIYAKNTGAKKSKSWKRVTGPRKHQLEAVSGELRPDIQEAKK